MKKYVIFPDYVKSVHDNGWHYIGFYQLVRLYNVPPNQCVDGSRPEKIRGIDTRNMIYLRPRIDGDYSCP